MTREELLMELEMQGRINKKITKSFIRKNRITFFMVGFLIGVSSTILALLIIFN